MAQPCLYLQGTAGVPAATAKDDRTLLAAILGGDPFGSAVPGIGPIARGHGVLAADALQVTENSPQGASVRVAPGMASVRGTAAGQYGCYVCPSSATEVLTIDAKSGTTGQNRKDLIVARVKDNENGVAGDVWALEVVKGTTGTDPRPDPTVPASSLVLARVNVLGGAGGTVITNANIDDLRPQARSVGGITPVDSAAAFPNPQPYDFIWDKSDSTLKAYLADGWNTAGINYDAPWQTFVPNWDGSVTIGNGTQYGRVWRMGHMVTGVAGFVFGSTTTMSGSLRLALPVPVHNPIAAARYAVGGRAWDSAPTSFIWSGSGEINPATQKIENISTEGLPVWSPTNPMTWATGDTFDILFNYETT